MKWATFQTEPAIHIIPASDTGHLYPWHVPNPWCECQPTPTQPTRPDQMVVWSHHDDH
jgi:hypothetical protein